MNNTDTKEAEKIIILLAELTGGDPAQLKKNIDDLGAQDFFANIEILAYPKEVIQKIKDLAEFLNTAEGSEKSGEGIYTHSKGD